MDINELMKKMNEVMDNLDFVSARKIMEENMKIINENRHLLRSNARSLLQILKDNTEPHIKPLNRNEMSVVHAINAYASKFDVRGLRMSIKSNSVLLMRKDIKQYLNEDAKTLLIGMKAIHIDE
ncbi:hypothetical protein PB01_07155 [Psychrobacillus glaciei]|uniref:Uncharacterized protein n=1 Tax=Psychrobacillus glaciei TaxID=2283160 RepID=A0A5J6SR50_9BACI|nr:hypothetical protein [Psychrobacillus glaciei]QFF98627.1 hypothetical protein PB01_07155 [Psychrobacillus glaciei]